MNMKPELMKNWMVVRNGNQIDIHVKDAGEGRELTIVSDVKDEDVARMIANAPRNQEAIRNAHTALQSIQNQINPNLMVIRSLVSMLGGLI